MLQQMWAFSDVMCLNICVLCGETVHCCYIGRVRWCGGAVEEIYFFICKKDCLIGIRERALRDI